MSGNTQCPVNKIGAAWGDVTRATNLVLGGSVLTSGGKVFGEDGKEYAIVAGVIRQDTSGSGWYVISDADHEPINISSIAQDAGSIALGYAHLDVDKVVSLTVTPDESFASSNITFGSSVTKGTAYVKCYTQEHNQGGYIEYDTGTSAFVNDSKGDSSNGVTSMVWDSGVKGLLIRHTSSSLKNDDWQNHVPSFTPVIDWTSPNPFSISVIDHGSNNGAGTFISFFDKDGVRIDTPTADLKFYWNRQVDNEPVLLNPNDVNAADYPLSNLWITGIFKLN